MKSSDINNYTFINPSPNLYRISKHIRNHGFNVNYVKIDHQLENQSERIYYFHDQQSQHFDLTMLEQYNDDKRCFNFKKTFINNYHFESFKKDFPSYAVGFDKGNFVDLQLLKKQRIKDILPIPFETVNSYSDLNDVDNDTCYIGGWFPEKICAGPCKVETVSVYETNMDAKHCFGNEYYVVLSKKTRVELFFLDGVICMIATKGVSPIESLIEQFAFLKKFEFKLTRSYNIFRNRKPWIKKTKSNYILLNDYSFFNVSVKMPDHWYEAVGRYLCSGKLS